MIHSFKKKTQWNKNHFPLFDELIDLITPLTYIRALSFSEKYNIDVRSMCT